eukprot:jgi/Undpi1/8809/HiC_scaffold_25.g11271.m1
MLVLARTAVARAAAATSGGGLSLAAKRSVGSARSVVSTSRQAVAVASLGNGGNQSMHSSASSGLEMHGTTILCVRKNGKVVMMGDGQVSQGDMVVKPNATKVRKLSEGRVLAGYAGSTADALTLMERLEGKLEEHEGQLQNACVSLAKDWRTDKYLRRLEAVVLVADSKTSLKVTGLGDVLAPSGGVIGEKRTHTADGCCCPAARALAGQEELSAEEVARRAMEIASELCVYTNNNFTVHSLDDEPDVKDEE